MFMTDAPATSITTNFTRAEKSKNWPIPEERKALRLVSFWMALATATAVTSATFPASPVLAAMLSGC